MGDDQENGCFKKRHIYNNCMHNMYISFVDLMKYFAEMKKDMEFISIDNFSFFKH